MSYRIVKTEPFKVFGLEGIVSTAGDARYFPNEGAIWGAFNTGLPNCKYDTLQDDAGNDKPPFYDDVFVKNMCKVHGMSNYNPIDDTTYGYMLWGFVTPDAKTDGYKIVEIPASTWVVIVGSVMKNDSQLFWDWLPTSEYKKVDGPDFDMYGWENDCLYEELWFSVIKK